ncbi:hypothetical protein BZZ01_00685 [Nostocales cyanobacterium HT-58-2]|nr:hypothetical protein BZZ01_00685 [Nostocales cyanobacterium HT-58-2]
MAEEPKLLIKLDAQRKKILRVYLGWTLADVERAISNQPSLTVDDVLKVFSQEEWNELSLKLASFAGPETKSRQRQQAYQKGLVTQRNKDITRLEEEMSALQEQIRKDRKQIEINQKEIGEQQKTIEKQEKAIAGQKQEIERQEKEIEVQQKFLNKNAIVIKKLQESGKILKDENIYLREISESQQTALKKIRDFIISKIKYIPLEIKKFLDIS